MKNDRSGLRTAPALLAPFEGLRGLAALAVCLYHLHHVPGLSDMTQRVPGFFGSGWVFVDVFFVLSGWVIAHVYGDRMVAGIARPRAFFLARIARLWPLHMTVLVTWFALAPMLFASPGPGAFAGCLGQMVTLSFTWGPLACVPPVPPAWSISAEMVAYLAFPLIMAAGLLRTRAGGLGLLVAGISGYFAMQMLWGGFHVYDGRAPLRALSGFSIGLGLWRLTRDSGGVTGRNAARLQCVALGALLAGIALDLTPGVMLAASVILILAVAAGEGPCARILSTRPFMTLGRLSYGLYLWHWFAIVALAQLGDAATLPLALVSVGLLLLCAELSYRLIEMPARRAIKHRLAEVAPAPRGAMEG